MMESRNDRLVGNDYYLSSMLVLRRVMMKHNVFTVCIICWDCAWTGHRVTLDLYWYGVNYIGMDYMTEIGMRRGYL